MLASTLKSLFVLDWKARAALHLISIIFTAGFPERSLSIVIIVLYLFESIILSSQIQGIWKMDRSKTRPLMQWHQFILNAGYAVHGML